MVVYEDIGDGMTKAYSSIGMYIEGGFPPGLYEEAVDPTELGRTYTETNIPVEKDETEEDVSESTPDE